MTSWLRHKMLSRWSRSCHLFFPRWRNRSYANKGLGNTHETEKRWSANIVPIVPTFVVISRNLT